MKSAKPLGALAFDPDKDNAPSGIVVSLPSNAVDFTILGGLLSSEPMPMADPMFDKMSNAPIVFLNY
jgi:hypothetical protein